LKAVEHLALIRCGRNRFQAFPFEDLQVITARLGILGPLLSERCAILVPTFHGAPEVMHCWDDEEATAQEEADAAAAAAAIVAVVVGVIGRHP